MEKIILQSTEAVSFFFLLDLLFYVPIIGNGHVGTLPPFYGNSFQHWNAMTCVRC